jgi:hypothetical protein
MTPLTPTPAKAETWGFTDSSNDERGEGLFNDASME